LWILRWAYYLLSTKAKNIPAIETLAVKLQIGPGALVAALASFVLLALCIQLSVSISGLQRQLQLLNEDVALQKKLIEDGLAHKN
jgi:hypothetical protein